MPNPNDLLSRAQIVTLHQHYDRSDANDALEQILTGMYAATAKYLKVIGENWYDEDETEPPGEVIGRANRERCLIALLTSRGAGLTLAIHIYLALMEGVEEDDELTPDEIANIIFLTGVYTGSDNMARGLITLTATLNLLKTIADDPDVRKKNDLAVLMAIKNALKS